MISKWQAVVIDCADPDALASFYERMLGMVRVQHDEGWVVIGDAEDRPGIAFQRVEEYVAPEWPGHLHPAQMHLDIKVKDMDAAQAEVLGLGARPTNSSGEDFRVYLDPESHPFCLVNW